MAEKNKDSDFESQLHDLQTIVRRLEDEQLPLEQGVSLFKQGIKLSQACRNRLQQAQKEVAIYIDGSWQDFEQGDNT